MTVLAQLVLPITALFAAAGGPSCQSKPILRIGFLTDTHLRQSKKSCENIRGAFDIFRREGCAAVVHCGDLSDWHYAEAYENYRETLEEFFPPDMEDRPQFLYVFANHDTLDPKRKDPKLRATRQMDHDVAFRDMCNRLKIDHWYSERREVNGYPILVFPQIMAHIGGYPEVEKAVARACADYPGKPVFVCTHHASMDTCYDSERWGDRKLRNILNRFPQVVQFSGHTHGSLRNEASIWQGEFTAVDVCCLEWWQGHLIGTPIVDKPACGVVVADVYPSRIEVRRIDVRDGAEILPESRWVVPLPHDPKTAPLRTEERRRLARPGGFADGAAIACKPDATPFSKLVVSFPSVTNEEDVCVYRVEIARRTGEGEWAGFACREVYSEFYKKPKERTGTIRAMFPKSTLCPSANGSMSSGNYFGIDDTACRLSVTPVGFFGTVGQALTAELPLPAPKFD